MSASVSGRSTKPWSASAAGSAKALVLWDSTTATLQLLRRRCRTPTRNGKVSLPEQSRPRQFCDGKMPNSEMQNVTAR